jgi:hypothetical protein
VGLSAQLERPKPAQLVREEKAETRVPWWLYPQVLSFDAPLVAVCWQWLLARSFHAGIAAATLTITGICVWMIYAVDHFLDVRRGAAYSARHRFVQEHRRGFLLSLIGMFATAAVLVWQIPAAIRNAGMALTAVVTVYLLVVHLGGERVRRYWPKEVAIGLVFGAGSSLATWSGGSAWRRAWPEILLFAALCTLNCAAVDCWEWRADRVLLRYPHRITRWLARHFYGACLVVLVAALVAAVVAALVAQNHSGNPAACALAISSALLLAVAALRRRLSPDLARLLADAVLLTPLIFLVR